MKPQRPITSDDEHVVLKFRPRAPIQPHVKRDEPVQPIRLSQVANDLSRFEQPREQPDDFRQRMLANIAGFAFTVALTAVALWLVMSISDLRKSQDCLQTGRRDCAKISILPRN